MDEILKTPETLWEYITALLDYTIFTINQTPITLFSLVMFLMVFLGFWLFSFFLQRVLRRQIFKRMKVEHSLGFNLTRILHYLIMVIGAIIAFQFIGIDFSGLAVIFGFLSVGIGFGLQNITANFISGLILLFERPIRVGDRVSVGETVGDVITINMRSTVIRTLNNVSIIVPNSDLISKEVTNWSVDDPRVRLDLPVGVSYNSDLDTVVKTLTKVALSNKLVLKKPAPEVHLREFGDSSWNMQLRVWLESPLPYEKARNQLNQAMVHAFREAGIEIPFPQRDVHIKEAPGERGGDSKILRS
ncbi:MAG TPA: mechanosensitive ion channel [Calditrichia bacterium]|nr:mechanosensitive ion channel [Calditrichota bacterium]HQU73700.1 mechanosensitive ion channel [Calditrichia bacterium]HQV33673.1 mechanosensitive ion channel [Calditrichia bacterium]